MTKQQKIHLILASLATLLPIPVGLLLAPDFPKGLILWPPVFMVLGELAALYFTIKDPGNKGRNHKPLTVVLWVIPILSNLCFGLTFALAMGYEFSPAALTLVPMGLLFAAIGNYLPKVKMNKTLGIKVPWAYTSRENWDATHRFAGRLWFAGGIVIAASALLPEESAIAILLVLTIGMCIAPMAYSYRYYRIQKAQGDALLPMPKMFLMGSDGKVNWTRTAVIWTIPALLLLGSVLMLYTGDIEYHIYDEYLGIETDFMGDTYMFYDVIESVEFRDENVEGTRVGGFGSFRLLLGFFSNQEFGGYTRYTYYDPGCAIVLRHQSGQVYVLSARNPAQTYALYQALLEKIG